MYILGGRLESPRFPFPAPSRQRSPENRWSERPGYRPPTCPSLSRLKTVWIGSKKACPSLRNWRSLTFRVQYDAQAPKSGWAGWQRSDERTVEAHFLGVSPPDRQLKVGAPAALWGSRQDWRSRRSTVRRRKIRRRVPVWPGHPPAGLPSAVRGEAAARSCFPSGVRPTPAVGYPIHWVALGREQGKEQPEDPTLKMAHAASAIEYPLQDYRRESSRAA